MEHKKLTVFNLSGAMDLSLDVNRQGVISRAPSEDVGEAAGAFNDLVDELGVASASDADSADLLPSCCLFLFLDCLFLNICNSYKYIKPEGRVTSTTSS